MMIVFALLIIAAVLYINPTLYKTEHKRLEDNMSNLDRRVSSDLVGHKTSLLKQNRKIESDFQAANETIERSLANIQEELKAINDQNNNQNRQLRILFNNIDSLLITTDKIICSQRDVNGHIEEKFDAIAQWPALLEGQIDRLSERQSITNDSLWNFLKDNATWKMKKAFKTLNP
tara:strand:- start:136 stop:660 length:525 start_codon:yes stop_codon:yes gene_type:complete